MTLADVIIIISRDGGAFVSRWLHVVVGITWIGLLYYFNFVQVPAFAEMEAAARNNAIDKLASRALWWFRWAAAATVATGLLILLFQRGRPDRSAAVPAATTSRRRRACRSTPASCLALTMFFNVWLVIWPNQKKVIANARNVQAGGEADPDAAAAGRKALARLAHEHDLLAPHAHVHGRNVAFFGGFKPFPSGGERATYWIIAIVIWLVLELNALGVIGGTKPGGLNGSSTRTRPRC